MEEIKRISRDLKFKGSILDFYQDTVQFEDGRTEKWDFVSHRMGAACVLPITDDGKILLVHQYRNAIDRVTTEIPAGKRDSLDEDTKICAMRELEEETGFRAGKIELLLKLRSTIAFCDEFIDVYLATDLENIGQQHLDEGESIEVEAIDIDEFCQKIYAGEIQDAKTVAAVMAYKAKFQK